MSIPNPGTGGKISMKCIANEYGFCENTLPLSLDDLSNLIKLSRKHAMSEFGTCVFDNTASYVLVGGGGGGGSNHAGGGGAGGFYYGYWDIPTYMGCDVPIVIGAGGAKSICGDIAAVNGNNSSFCINVPGVGLVSVLATGGGRGGNRGSLVESSNVSPQQGNAIPNGNVGTSGSGGGGLGGYNNGQLYSGASGCADGNSGGAGYGGSSGAAGGGGGGSCCPGLDASSCVAGNGGQGCRTITNGVQFIYGNGGNGGCSTSGNRENSAANSGDGGSGGGQFNGDGGNGGSGIFVVSYYNPLSVPRLSGGTITNVDNRTIHTFNSSGTLRFLSSDEIWLPVTMPGQSDTPTIEYQSIAHGEFAGQNTFMAVATGGSVSTVSTSTDGYTWTRRSSTIGYTAVGYSRLASDTVSFLLSKQDGTLMYSRSTTANPNSGFSIFSTSISNHNSVPWQSIIGNGVNGFVGVGQGRILTSDWSGLILSSTSIEAPQNNSWRGIAYSSTLGLYVAVSLDGTNRVMTTSNPNNSLNWTLRNAAAQNSWTDVTWGNGLFVAVAQDGTNRVMTSSDGITWTSRSAPQRTWSRVNWGNGRFVAVSFDGYIMISTNGTTWKEVVPSQLNTWSGLAVGTNKFVAISTDGTNRAMVSEF